MRICLISREFPPDTGWGGIATFVHDLALGLKETGHEVEVIALSTDHINKVTDYHGVAVHRVAWTSLLEDKQRLLTVMPYSHNILKQISALWERFAEIHRENPFEVVEAPEMFAEGVFVAVSKAAPLVVRLYTPHFKFIDESFHNISASFDHQFIGMLERLTMLSADLVTSPSQDLAKYVSNDLNYPISDIPIVRDPVNTDKFCPEGPCALQSDGRLTVLFAGRLEARKGIYHLMEAIPRVVRKFPCVRFVIVGRDTDTAAGGKSVLAELKQMLSLSGASENVIFIPAVPNSEMPAYFRSADICVVPSLYDNAPFTCIESLSSGKPVIGTSAGGMKEYIVDGYSGLIVPAADNDALAEAILDLLTNHEKRLSFGRFAREYVLTNFDRKKIARQSVELYKKAKVNFETSREYALYRHELQCLMPDLNSIISAYDQMLYDRLYHHSLGFRLSHWWCMLRDRPKLTIARAISKALNFIFQWIGFNDLPSSLKRLEAAIESQSSNPTERVSTAATGDTASGTRRPQDLVPAGSRRLQEEFDITTEN